MREGVARVHGVPVPLDRAVAGRAGRGSSSDCARSRGTSWRRPREAGATGPTRRPSRSTSSLVESLGSESFVYGRPVGAEEGSDRVTVRLDKRTHLTVGDTVHVEPNHGEVHLFDAASGERIEA